MIRNSITNFTFKKIVLFIICIFMLTGSSICQITLNKTIVQQNQCNNYDVNLTIAGISSPVPIDVMLVIDCSGSMTSGSPSSMYYTKNAAINFVRKLFSPDNNPGNINRVGIVSYSNIAQLDQELSYASDSTLIITAINNMVANGTTNIADGFYQASKEMTLRGRTDCSVLRSVVLFTDGVANKGSALNPANDHWEGASCPTLPTTHTPCTISAYLRGQESQSFVNGGSTYSNQVYTVGLFGGINGATQTLAANTLTLAQNSGFYQTESAADLDGIYNQIFDQLLWAAKAVPGFSMVSDTIMSGFSFINGTLQTSQGLASINGQSISWDLPYINNGTYSLSYSVNAENNISCGPQKISTSWILYQDQSCAIIADKFPEAEVCIPCTQLSQISLIHSGCGNAISFNGSLASANNACSSNQQSYVWEFTMNGAIVGTDTGLTGTFIIPSQYAMNTCNGSIKGILRYDNGNGCDITMGEYTLDNLVIDNLPPLITTPAASLNVTLACASDIPAIDPNAISATDNCTGIVTISYAGEDVDSGSCANKFTTTRTYRATDICGNHSDFVQTIVVNDSIAPYFTSPADIIIYSNADCTYDAGVAATGDVTDETDNCSAGLQATYTDEISDGPCQGSKVITRTWHLTDDCGNAAVDQIQTITVRDTIPPTFTPPVDITIYSTANCTYDAGIATTGDVTDEADNCSAGLQATFTDVISGGPCQGSKVIIRTWHLTDDCGNAANDQIQTITVRDTLPPTFTRPADITIYTNADCTFDAGITATGDITDESDNCSAGLQATFTDVTTGGPCQGSKIITRIWHLVDNCGNAAAGQVQTITISDTTAPVISCTANITVNNDAGLCGANVTIAQPAVVENCSSVTILNSFNQTDDASGYYPVGTTLVVWTATDACGNTSSCSTLVTVIDNEAPMISCPADITSCSPAIDLGTPVVSDNCGVESVVNNAPAAFPTGITLVTWTVTDIHGNTATCQQTITISNLKASATGTAILNCFDSNDGIITVTVTEGKAPYFYSLDYGAAQTSNTFTNLATGVHNIRITDAMQCETTLDQAIANRDPLLIDNSDVTDANCSGKNDGSIKLSVMGGEGPYQYNWSNGATTEAISDLGAGEYTVTITDNNGCELKYAKAIIAGNQEEPLVITNAFSPNGDGINDTWVIRNIETHPENELIVFNRWGNEVFSTKNYANNWDGSNLSEGTFFYILNVEFCSLPTILNGYITIIR